MATLLRKARSTISARRSSNEDSVVVSASQNLPLLTQTSTNKSCPTTKELNEDLKARRESGRQDIRQNGLVRRLSLKENNVNFTEFFRRHVAQDNNTTGLPARQAICTTVDTLLSDNFLFEQAYPSTDSSDHLLSSAIESILQLKQANHSTGTIVPIARPDSATYEPQSALVATEIEQSLQRAAPSTPVFRRSNTGNQPTVRQPTASLVPLPNHKLIPPPTAKPIRTKTKMSTSSAEPPVSYEKLQEITIEACNSVLEPIPGYSHKDTESWNTAIINKVLSDLVSATSSPFSSNGSTDPTSTAASSPRYKFVVTSTIIQHRSASEEKDPVKKTGRRGMHCASGAYWNDSKDGMWSFKYEVAESKGLDVMVHVVWVYAG